MKKAISTKAAPQAIGPYSPAIVAGDFLFVSGQVAIDPATGNLVSGDARAQTGRVMKNLQALLQAAGVGFEQVVRSTVYLKSMGDFAAMNEVYAQHFPAPHPARSTVEVARLPKDALVEIDVVALMKK